MARINTHNRRSTHGVQAPGRAARVAATLLGLAAVAGLNWQLWRREQARVEHLRAERDVLPVLRRAPSLSVLALAWNHGERVERHIESFLALCYPTAELILCAGGTDDTFARAVRCAGPRVHVSRRLPGESDAAALARCYAHASGEILLLTEIDYRYDDEALLRLLAPLVNDGEPAATGATRPLDEQLGRLLPQHLWATELVASTRASAYSSGLLGHQTAVSRAALEHAGGLDALAQHGTDARVAIRAVPESVVPVAYPETLSAYRRSQHVRLRGLLTRRDRSSTATELLLAARTAATGLALLLAPLLVLAGHPRSPAQPDDTGSEELPTAQEQRRPLALGDWALIGWTLLLAHTLAAKLRYALLAARLSGRPTPPRLLLASLPLTLLDAAVWLLALLDMIDPRRREQW